MNSMYHNFMTIPDKQRKGIPEGRGLAQAVPPTVRPSMRKVG